MGKIRVGRAELHEKGAWVTAQSFIDFVPTSQSNLNDKHAWPLAPRRRPP